MNGLRARLLEHVPSPDGTQADVLLIEPNGDEHRVRCLCKRDGTTDLGGDGEMVAFLNDKYGEQTVWALARQMTLG
ncbi:MAG: hypothetical protein BGO01_07745 [Armatimonadetes bacterium 55-13]|nr:hypothetical protein [Armatimonadota bacterium]OJU63752.1 MAG: hypothetical protein BGO01_07745 [Armatimonadetes bacterium 55-13]